MTTKAGVWIDPPQGGDRDRESRRRAYLRHSVEGRKASGALGDSPLHGRYEARQVPSDDRRQRALTAELNVYYDAVLAAVRDVESLLICGPGEAKGS